MRLPPVHWTTTAVCLIAAGIALQSLEIASQGAAAAAAGLGIAAAAEVRHAARWRRGFAKGTIAIISLTAAAILQTYAAAASPQWQIAPASFAAALPGAIIVTAAKLAEVRASRAQRRRAAKAAQRRDTTQRRPTSRPTKI